MLVCLDNQKSIRQKHNWPSYGITCKKRGRRKNDKHLPCNYLKEKMFKYGYVHVQKQTILLSTTNILINQVSLNFCMLSVKIENVNLSAVNILAQTDMLVKGSI
jgi:hypothetical protein